MPASLSNRKTTQALNFFAEKSGGEINRMKALKLLFFADRYHLRKYGRSLSEAHYVAMKFGPVASEAKNLTELAGLNGEELDYARQFLATVATYLYRSVAEFDRSVFSQSDLEAMEFAWSTFGQHDEFTLSLLTHCYPEWNKHEEVLRFAKSAWMDYNDFFLDPSDPADPCHVLSDEEKTVAIELFRDRQDFQARWR